MKRQAIIICGISALILGAIFIACSSDANKSVKVRGNYELRGTDITSCKTETRSAEEGEEETYVHVLEYEATADGNLHLKDVNLVVSCSLQAMDVKTKLEGNVITIDEYEITDDVVSTCVCPVDFDMVVGPLEDGDYTLVYCIAGQELARIPLHYNSQLKDSYTIPATEPEATKDPVFMEVDGIRYGNDPNSSPHTVWVAEKLDYNTWTGTYKGGIVIPSQITYEGSTYIVTTIGAIAFYSCQELQSVSIPNSVTLISDEAFGASGIKSIDIPESVTTIGQRAFHACKNLERISLPQKIEDIGSSAFSECSSLTSVQLPEGLFQLSNELFSYCSNLKSIIIPEGPATIWFSVFRGCINLESVTLPASVQEMFGGAFLDCPSLTKIYSLNPEAPEISSKSDEVFDESVMQNATLYVPKGSKESYSKADYWNRFVHIEELEE